MALSRQAACIFMVAWKYVLSVGRNWHVPASGSCLRVNCKFMRDIRPGQGSAVIVPSPEEQIINRIFVQI